MSEIKLFKIVQGRVKAHKINGTYIKSIGDENAVDARLQGDVIAITYGNGTVKLYNENGTYVKTL